MFFSYTKKTSDKIFEVFMRIIKKTHKKNFNFWRIHLSSPWLRVLMCFVVDFDDNWLFLLSLIIVQLNCQASISRQLREKMFTFTSTSREKEVLRCLIAYLDLPVVCRIVPFHHKKKPTPKGRNFTYLEDPGIVSWNVRLRGQAVFFGEDSSEKYHEEDTSGQLSNFALYWFF